MIRRLVLCALAVGALFSGFSPWGPLTGRAQGGAVPGAPVIGFAQPVNPLGSTSVGGAVRVSFRAPSSVGGSAITSYTATATPIGGGSAVSATGATSPLVITGLTNGTTYTVSVRAQNASGLGSASDPSNQVTPRTTAIPVLDPAITWVLPTNAKLGGSSASAFSEVVSSLRTRIGDNSQLTRAKVGLSTFVALVINDYDVTASTPKAQLRANMAVALSQIDAVIAQAEPHGLPVGISLITMMVRDRSLNGGDLGLEEARTEDKRNMQWYSDQTTAPGWMTYSQYARKLRRVRELYIREFGRAVAERMQAHPNILVAITGDGESEMTYLNFKDVEDPVDPSKRSWADYSPFTVLEFRDWLTAKGLYATGQPLAGEAYAFASRYAQDSAPGVDGNGDGRTINGDFGRAFTSWDLRYFNWSLSDSDTAGAITGSTSTSETPGGFDPPRVWQPGNAWFEVWHAFRQQMLQRYNRDFAQWVTESSDTALSGVPVDRWYSAQVPADYLFGNPPPDFGVRHFTSASAHWTADVWPFGSNGVTGYNVNRGAGGASGPYFKTVETVVPKVDAFSERWGIVEWNPSDPYSTDRAVYDEDVAVLLKHRPSLLMPYRMVASNGVDDEPHWRVYNSGFEAALKEFVTKVGNPMAVGYGWSPVVTWNPPAVIAPGGTLTASTYLNATANMPGAFSYSPLAGTVVGTSGTVPVTAVFTPADSEYAPVTLTRTLSISSSPAMTLSHARLDFSGFFTGGVFTQITAPQTVSVNFDGASGSPAWTASVSPAVPWLQVSPASGAGAGQFVVTVPIQGLTWSGPIVSSTTVTVTAPTAGGGTSTRAVTVNLNTVAGTTGVSYGVSPSSWSVAAGGGSRDVLVTTTPAGYTPWKVSTSANWIRAVNLQCGEGLRTGVPCPVSSGVGSGYITLVAEPNSGAARTATVKVADKTVTVAQDGGSGGGGGVAVPGAPGQPVALVTGTSVSLSWTGASGTVEYYTLAVQRNGATYPGSPFNVGTANAVNAGPGLLAGTYTLTVTASNSSGAGPASPVGTFTIGSSGGSGGGGGGAAPGTPGQPVALVSGTSVSLSWAASSGTVTHYTLTVQRDGAPYPGSPFNVGTANAVNAGPSLPAGTYTVTVTATNSVGSSAASTAGTFTIVSGGGSGSTAPGQPGQPSASVVGSTVTLSWSPASGSVTAHRLVVTRNGSPFSSSPFTLGPGASIVAAGVPSGSYTVAVTALNGSLAGPESAPRTFTVP